MTTPQSFDTAPRDGTEILAWRKDCGWLLVRWDAPANFLTDFEAEQLGASADEYGWMHADFVGGGRLEGDEIPTLWLPMPSDPGDANDEPFDELGDLRREIEKLHARLDKQAERDAKLTRERAVLANWVRHGSGNPHDVRRIVDEALGDSSPWKLRFIGGREPNAVRSLDEAMRFKIKEEKR